MAPAALAWDDQANAVAFDYPGRGGTRKVWLENSLSIAFKIELAAKYGLAGVAISNVSNDPGQAEFWDPLRTYSETGTIQPATANSFMLGRPGRSRRETRSPSPRATSCGRRRPSPATTKSPSSSPTASFALRRAFSCRCRPPPRRPDAPARDRRFARRTAPGGAAALRRPPHDRPRARSPVRGAWGPRRRCARARPLLRYRRPGHRGAQPRRRLVRLRGV